MKHRSFHVTGFEPRIFLKKIARWAGRLYVACLAPSHKAVASASKGQPRLLTLLHALGERLCGTALADLLQYISAHSVRDASVCCCKQQLLAYIAVSWL